MAGPRPRLAERRLGERLRPLVGRWRVEARLPGRSAPLDGRATFRFLVEDQLMLMRSAFTGPGGPPRSVSVIGGDDDADGFVMLYTDERGVSRRYAMIFSPPRFALFRTAPGFHQRYLATVSRDGDTIAGAWEKSADGVAWVHDFELSYARR